MELKFMQNSKTTIKMDGSTVKVETTMTRVNLYKGTTLIGFAGVKNSSDFDYESLLALAKHKSGSSIQVA